MTGVQTCALPILKLGKIVSVEDRGDEISLLYDTREECKKYELKVKYDGYWIATVDEMLNLITLVRFPAVVGNSYERH